MVKITNGINVYEVTSGAYDTIYKHQGYQVVSDNADMSVFGDNAGDQRDADDIFVDEIKKKPISQWSKEEVKHYAGVKGIDLSGTRSINDAKELIKRQIAAEE